MHRADEKFMQIHIRAIAGVNLTDRSMDVPVVRQSLYSQPLSVAGGQLLPNLDFSDVAIGTSAMTASYARNVPNINRTLVTTALYLSD